MLDRIFRSPNAENAVKKLTDLALGLGLNLATVDFLRNFLFGYIEGYLNGATCNSCFTVLGSAKDVPDITYCHRCGKKVGTIKITPLRLYLAIANKADLFDVIPDRVKVNPRLIGPIKRFGPIVLKFYDSVSIDMIFEPLVAWLKEKRPDLYYTLAFYPRIPEWVQILYELETDRMDDDRLERIKKDLDLEDADRETLKQIIIKGLEKALDRRSEYYIVSEDKFIACVKSEEEAKKFIQENADRYPSLSYIKVTGVSTYALKQFAHMLDSFKSRLREVIARELGGV